MGRSDVRPKVPRRGHATAATRRGRWPRIDEDVSPGPPRPRTRARARWLAEPREVRKEAEAQAPHPRKGEAEAEPVRTPEPGESIGAHAQTAAARETGDPEKPTKKLSLWMKEEEMLGKFSEGIVFWFKLMRDHLLMFFIFMILSFWAFNQMRVSNERPTPATSASSLGRVTLAAIMIWSEDTQRKGETVPTPTRTPPSASSCRRSRCSRSSRHRLSPHEEGAGQGGGRRRDHLP